MNNDIKVFKYFISYYRERKWLEEMALQGLFLKDIRFGIYFTFYRDSPRKILYEMNRFDISKKPTLEEIKRKEMFMEIASEMGWKEVTHDETMTYYFCKEYEPDEINELCNDDESRKLRSEKFKKYYFGRARFLILFACILSTVNIMLMIYEDSIMWRNGLGWFTVVYNAFVFLVSLFLWQCGVIISREMKMSWSKWLDHIDRSKYKKKIKLILTMNALDKYLKKEENNGWELVSVTPLRYYFKKSETKAQVYTMDSKWLTNKRIIERAGQKIADKKDLNGINFDWLLESVREAEEKGWTFVCALESRAIIYKGDRDAVVPLNEERYKKRPRGISFIGSFAMSLFIWGLIGGITGWLLSMFILN
jgi:tmRNA-binding protein